MVQIITLIVCSVAGFLLGRNAYLNRISKVLLDLNICNLDNVGKVINVVKNYNKIKRQADKETKDAYKKVLVSRNLADIDKSNKGE